MIVIKAGCQQALAAACLADTFAHASASARAVHVGADGAGQVLTPALMSCSTGCAARKDGRGWHQQKARRHLQNRPPCTPGVQLSLWPISVCSHARCAAQGFSSPPDLSSPHQECRAARCMTALMVTLLLHQPGYAHELLWLALCMLSHAAVLHTLSISASLPCQPVVPPWPCESSPLCLQEFSAADLVPGKTWRPSTGYRLRKDLLDYDNNVSCIVGLHVS